MRNWSHYLMDKYSIDMKRSTALLKEPIIYSWSSVNILQNNYLCILHKKESHKGLKQHERVFSALLYCRLIVFHWKQFQHSSRFKHFLRTFPSVFLRNIKLYFFFFFWEKQNGQSFHTYSKQQNVTNGNEKVFILSGMFLCM